MFFQLKQALAVLIEIPLSLSTSRESVLEVPISTLPKTLLVPERYSMFSVIVVFPAST